MIEQKYQTVWRRTGAGLIDTLILTLLMYIPNEIIHKLHSIFLVGFWDIISDWLTAIYFVVLHGIYGQTIGKKICKVKILNKDENRLSFKQAALRDIVPIITNIASSVWIISNSELYYHFVTNPKDVMKSNAALPQWMLAISMVMCVWSLLEIVTMLTNKRRRAIHDFIAGSIVCRVD